MRKFFRALALLASGILYAAPAPITVQGVLRDSANAPYTYSATNIKVRFIGPAPCNDADGCDEISGQTVDIVNGAFSVSLTPTTAMATMATNTSGWSVEIEGVLAAAAPSAVFSIPLNALPFATVADSAVVASAAPWSGITGKPTTLAGYGITDAVSTGSPALGGALDFNGNNATEIANIIMNGSAADPGAPAEGQIWYNTTDNVLRYYDGGTVRTLSGDVVQGAGAADNYLTRWNTAAGKTLSNSVIRDDGTTLGIGMAPDNTAQVNISTTTTNVAGFYGIQNALSLNLAAAGNSYTGTRSAVNTFPTTATISAVYGSVNAATKDSSATIANYLYGSTNSAAVASGGNVNYMSGAYNVATASTGFTGTEIFGSSNLTTMQTGTGTYSRIGGSQSHLIIGGFNNQVVTDGWGMRSFIQSTNTGAGSSVGNYYGLQTDLQLGGGNHTVGNYYGLHTGFSSSTATMTVTNTYGLYIDDVTPALGSQTNQAYGLYQEDTGARNYFGGSVGAGTNSPQKPLHVSGVGGTGISDSVLRLDDTSAFASGVGGGIEFRGTYNGSGTQQLYAAIKARKSNGTSGNRDATLSFSTMQEAGGVFSEKMQITPSGTVRIGDLNSTARLAVQLNSDATGATYFNAAETQLNLINDTNVVGAGPKILFNTFNNGNAAAGIGMEREAVGPSPAGALRFDTRNGAGTFAERMRITSAGNVGIGMTPVSEKLEVAGNIKATGYVSALTHTARVHRDSNVAMTNNVYTLIEFNQEQFDSANLHDNVTNPSRLTAPVAGTYIITAQVSITTHSTAGDRYAAILLNSNGTCTPADHIAGQSLPAWAGGSVMQHLNITTTYNLAAGDYVEVCALQSSGTNLPQIWSSFPTIYGKVAPVFQMTRIGPAY